ncbi:MAG TPA: hypothetical protein PKY81_14470 [bacterium]|nr:hypothetical protein [bacterium]
MLNNVFDEIYNQIIDTINKYDFEIEIPFADLIEFINNTQFFPEKPYPVIMIKNPIESQNSNIYAYIINKISKEYKDTLNIIELEYDESDTIENILISEKHYKEITTFKSYSKKMIFITDSFKN